MVIQNCTRSKLVVMFVLEMLSEYKETGRKCSRSNARKFVFLPCKNVAASQRNRNQLHGGFSFEHKLFKVNRTGGRRVSKNISR